LVLERPRARPRSDDDRPRAGPDLPAGWRHLCLVDELAVAVGRPRDEPVPLPGSSRGDSRVPGAARTGTGEPPRADPLRGPRRRDVAAIAGERTEGPAGRAEVLALPRVRGPGPRAPGDRDVELRGRRAASRRVGASS